jgi:hypothetical protein
MIVLQSCMLCISMCSMIYHNFLPVYLFGMCVNIWLCMSLMDIKLGFILPRVVMASGPRVDIIVIRTGKNRK